MVAHPSLIRPVTSLPEDVGMLLDASTDEGYDFIERLVDDWNAGSNRFDLEGEIPLEARLDGQLVGIGGLNRDPYLEGPHVGRIRHLYVLPGERGVAWVVPWWPLSSSTPAIDSRG